MDERLAGRVEHARWQDEVVGDRGDVDDLAQAAPQHLRQGQRRQVGDTFDVHLEHSASAVRR
ncbi:MAG TPA: hypothetical protein VKX96_00140 [Chloroflexota bacterium]|nr:hypothetical protein [Chloroflexota bacterium]